MTDVLVLGAGALGSVYAAAFSEAGCDVTVLARPQHAAVVARSGLVVESAEGERRVRMTAVSDPSRAPAEVDLLLVSAKANDVPGIVHSVGTSPGLVFSIQNGVGKDTVLEEKYGQSAVVGCVSMVGATLLEPGRVAHTMNGVTYLGDPPGVGGAAKKVADLLEAGGMPAEIRDDIRSVEWSKAVLAVAAMGATGLTRLPYHRVFLDTEAAGIFLDLVVEAASVARLEGVDLVDLPGPLQIATLSSASRPEAHRVMRAVGERLVRDGQTRIRVSTLQSIESGRPTEVEAVHGRVLEKARSHGVDLPVTRTVARALRAIDAAIEGE